MIIANILCETISLRTSLHLETFRILFERRVLRSLLPCRIFIAPCKFMWTRTIVLGYVEIL